MIRLNSLPHFFAFHVLFKLIDVEPNRPCVGFEQFARIRSLAPSSLFSIQRVVHFPKVALQPGGFGCQRRLAGVLVQRKREIPKHDPQTGVVFFQ